MTKEERLKLANYLFQKYYTQCFWYCRRDLEITEDLIPIVLNGLRNHGGHVGFGLAGKLRQDAVP